MPALVNSSVGSFAGSSGLERTRVCPCCSKYCKNFSRISLPVMIRWSLACATAALKTTLPQNRALICEGRAVDCMGSVPGAVATGSKPLAIIDCRSCYPVATAPGTDLILKLTRNLRFDSVDSYDRSVIQDGYFARGKHHAYTRT